MSSVKEMLLTDEQVATVVALWKKALPLKQDIINTSEIEDVASKVVVSSFDSSEEKKTVEFYNAYIDEGMIKKYEDDDFVELIRNLECSKTGTNPQDMFFATRYGKIKVMVTNDKKLSGQIVQSIKYDDTSIVTVALAPREWKKGDCEFISSCIYHELRHGYDAIYAGLKPYKMTKDLVNYYSNISEARAFSDQIVYLVNLYMRVHHLDVFDAIGEICEYLYSDDFIFHDIPDMCKQLMVAFMDEIGNNPMVLKTRNFI